MIHFLESKPVFAKIWKLLRLPTDIQLRIMRLVQDQFLVGVTGVIFNKQNKILLFKHTYRQTMWSLPGGYLKKGEHPYETLEREVKEESGLEIVSDQSLQTQADRQNARLDICIAGELKGGQFRPSAEVSHYGFFSYNQLPKVSKDQEKIIRSAFSATQSESKEYIQIPQRAFIQYT